MATGGSRHGAGRPGWRRKCEHSLPLDIRRLNRKGLLRAGTSFGWQWHCDGEPCGSVGLHAHAGHIEFAYTRTPQGEDPQHITFRAALERTPCHFGGERAWFRCPRCWRRCAILYGLARDGRFGCRVCLGLAYASEAEDPVSRLWRKQRKLEAKLGENGERPRGMRQRTFERICAQIDAIERAKDAHLLLSASALLRRAGINLDEILA